MGLDDFERELAREKLQRQRAEGKAASSSRRSGNSHGHRESGRHHRDREGEEKRSRHASDNGHSHGSSHHGGSRHRSHHHHRSDHESSHSGRESRSGRSREHRSESKTESKTDRHRHGSRHKRARSEEQEAEAEAEADERHGSRQRLQRSASPDGGDGTVDADDSAPRLAASTTTIHSIHPEDASNVTHAEPKSKLQRDSWMEAPSALDIDYINRPNARQRQQELQEASSSRMLQSDLGTKLHERELNRHLTDVNAEEEADAASNLSAKAEHTVDYTFGDSGSQWRMVKLKSVYRVAEQTGRPLEDVALERYGSLRAFDDAREEETELDRRATYGAGYVGKDRPSGELYQQRKLDAGERRDIRSERQKQQEVTEAHWDALQDKTQAIAPGQAMQEDPPKQPLDSTSLNRLKARLMKAKLRNAPELAQLQAEYDASLESSQTAAFDQVSASRANEHVVLTARDFRLLADPKNEVKPITNKRGIERGTVTANEDMSIDDMVREERRTRGGPSEGMKLAEQITKDAKFENDLEYMGDNARKLARQTPKSAQAIRNSAINSFQKSNRLLESCPLCFHEDAEQPPIAPVVSLGTRAYLTLPTEPEVTEGGAVIVPLDHHINLLECDDDEWEEIRNFMKSLIRLYHDQGRDVLFYENAANPARKLHAAMVAVPIPYEFGDTAPAFFREAILGADEEWTQHKKLIDTLANSKKPGYGRAAFRRSIAKEMPYFHVWFALDGGLGHIVEDPTRWPRGDLFAREIIGGIVGAPPEIIKKQGRWKKGQDARLDGFRKRWRKFDWTRVLEENAT
ncbi:hypothetical protein KEM52_005740 [Ascosphaera acerosa]|nr:hypothetical protein KEM52_005740 [Ascosphaera acerosa]